MGSPGYASPEQLAGAPATPGDDIYALGVLLFELLTGRRPFQAENALELAMATMTRTPPAVHELNPDVPPQLSALIARALSHVRAPAIRAIGCGRRAPSTPSCVGWPRRGPRARPASIRSSGRPAA
jgi:serine/threonine protein kinase